MEELPGIERTVWLPATPEEVWPHLTDGRLISTWFEGCFTLRPRPGGDVRFQPEGGEVHWGTVEEVDDHRAIQWSWRTDDGDPSVVRIELEPEEEGTRMTVTERLLRYEMRFHPLIQPEMRTLQLIA